MNVASYWGRQIGKVRRGGGYDDWYLPTKEELNWIYDNLRRKGKITGDTWYWSSSSYSANLAWVQIFLRWHSGQQPQE